MCVLSTESSGYIIRMATMLRWPVARVRIYWHLGVSTSEDTTLFDDKYYTL